MSKKQNTIIHITLLSCFLMLSTAVINAQQSVVNSLYSYNRLNFNPAFAGVAEKTPIDFYIRQQWIGFEDAPRTQYLSTHSYLPLKIGIGGQFFNNVTGPTRQTGLKFAMSKHLEINKEHFFSFGLTAELYQNLFDTENLETGTPNDPALDGEVQQTLAPDASLGVLFFSNDYFVGLSATNLIQSSYDIFNTEADFQNPVSRTYYLTGGYVFKINPDVKYKPSALVKKTIALPMQADITNQFVYKNIFSGGFSFRTNLDLIFMAGIRYGFFEFAYAYDIALSDMKTYSSGSQELLLRVNIVNRFRSSKKYGKHKGELLFDW